MDNEDSQLYRLHMECKKHLEEDARKVLEKKVLKEDPILCKKDLEKEVMDEDPILCKEVIEKKVLEEDPILCKEVLKEDPVLCKEVLEKKVMEEDPILCKEVLEKKVLEEDPILCKEVLEEDPVLCKEVLEKKVMEEDPILCKEVLAEDPVLCKEVLEKKVMGEDPILCKEVLEKKILKDEPILCKEVLEEDPNDKSLCESVVYCHCSEIETFSPIQLLDKTHAFVTPSNEPVLFVAICGKLKSMKDIGEFIWFEVEDETGVVLCRTESPETVEDIDGKEEYGKFVKQFKKMLEDGEKNQSTIEEMRVVLSMKRGTWRAKQKYSALQSRDFQWCDKEKTVIVHGKLAKMKANMFIFVKRVWMAQPVEARAFRQMLLTAKEN